MRNLLSTCLGTLLTVFVLAGPVQAADPIVYVSASGNDASACTFAAPCRTLQRAVNVSLVGGVVQVLSSAAYGNATITKSLTIDGGGNVVALGSRIIINNASAIVVLRGLVMDGRGLGSGLTGIRVSDAAAVHIEDCEIARYTGSGIEVTGTVTGAELFISDTISRENTFQGLRVIGAKSVDVENSRFENNNSIGLYVFSAFRVNITRTTASGNAAAGIQSSAATANITETIAAGNLTGIHISSGTANFTETTAADNSNAGFYFEGSVGATVDSSLARGNNIGVDVGSDANVAITDSVISSNPTAINNAGTVYTRQNNTVGGTITGSAAIPFSAY